jgi:hypothetical protein
LKRWVATLIAKPDVKMNYGLLLVSETQGVGKTTLGEKILAPLLGINNVSFPGEKEVVGNQFNTWCSHKRLAVINEIYAGHSAAAYNELKSYATDRTITVNQKYMPAYLIDNWVHVMACSNSPRALHLSTDDRRWLVPEVTEVKKNNAYWSNFNSWLISDGGLRKIKGWAEKFAIEEGQYVKTGEEAPLTAAKKEMIREGFSPGMTCIADALEVLLRRQKEFAISDATLIEHVKQRLYEGRHSDRLERPLTARRVAKGLQLYTSKKQIWDGNRMVRIITNNSAYANGHFQPNGDYIKDYNELSELLSL